MLDMHMHVEHISRMKLTDYLLENEMNAEAFAEMAGLSQSQISRLCRGASLPSYGAIEAIRAATNGAVLPDDWFPNFTKAAEVEPSQ